MQRIYYHGSPEKFNISEIQKDENGLIFFTSEKYVATQFGNQIYSVNLSYKNAFDPQNLEHIARLKKYITDNVEKLTVNYLKFKAENDLRLKTDDFDTFKSFVTELKEQDCYGIRGYEYLEDNDINGAVDYIQYCMSDDDGWVYFEYADKGLIDELKALGFDSLKTYEHVNDISKDYNLAIFDKKNISKVLGVEDLEINKHRVLYHVTPFENIDSILEDGLEPRVGERSALLDEEKCIFLFKSKEDLNNALGGWLGEQFEDTQPLGILKIAKDSSMELSSENCADYEIKCMNNIEPTQIELIKIDANMTIDMLAVEDKVKSLLTEYLGGFIDFKVRLKQYENSIGGFSKYSLIEEYEPTMYINTEIERLFTKNEIANNIVKTYIAEDTLLHEYGHLLYELIEEEDIKGEVYRVIDFLDKDYLEEFAKQEFPDLAEEIEEYGFDEFLENYYDEYEYVREEVFAESFFSYVRNLENNEDYKWLTSRACEKHVLLEQFFSDNIQSLMSLSIAFCEESDNEVKYSQSAEKIIEEFAKLSDMVIEEDLQSTKINTLSM